MHYCYFAGLGLVPMVFALLMILFTAQGAGPGLWCALGLSAGLQLILWGSYRLHQEPALRTPWARRLAANSARWFPALMFVAWNGFAVILGVLLWLTVVQNGYPAGPAIHATVIAIIALIPIKGLAREWHLVCNTQRSLVINELLFFGLIILVALFLTLSLISFNPSTVKTPDQNYDPVIVVTWMGFVLVCLGCLSLPIRHLRRPGTRPATPPAPQRPIAPADY